MAGKTEIVGKDQPQEAAPVETETSAEAKYNLHLQLEGEGVDQKLKDAA